MKTQYYRMMFEKKYDIEYLQLHKQKNNKINKGLSVFLAITGTGSLGGIAFNRSVTTLVAIVLVCSQLIIAAMPYLPFEKRDRELDKCIHAMNIIYTDIENFWHIISYSDIKESEIQAKIAEYENKWTDVKNSVFKLDSLPTNDDFSHQAYENTKQYFRSKFGVEDNG